MDKMDGTNLANIICGAFSLIGVIVVALISNHTKAETKRGADASVATKKEVSKINERLDKFEAGLDQNNLQTCRIDLRQAFHHSRDDIPATLELSWRYFVDLHGNADLGPKFLQWVEEYKVREWAKEHKYPLTTIIKYAKHPGGRK